MIESSEILCLLMAKKLLLPKLQKEKSFLFFDPPFHFRLLASSLLHLVIFPFFTLLVCFVGFLVVHRSGLGEIKKERKKKKKAKQKKKKPVNQASI